MTKTLLYICSAFNLLFGLFHLSFWNLFNWKAELAGLSPENRGILQMFNIASLYMLVFAAFITYRLAKKDAYSFSEKALLLFFAGYYIVRILFGYPFFGFSFEEMIVWVICAGISFCYIAALCKSGRTIAHSPGLSRQTQGQPEHSE